MMWSALLLLYDVERSVLPSNLWQNESDSFQFSATLRKFTGQVCHSRCMQRTLYEHYKKNIFYQYIYIQRLLICQTLKKTKGDLNTVKQIMWKIESLNPSTLQFTYSIGYELPSTDVETELWRIREKMCYKSRMTIPATSWNHSLTGIFPQHQRTKMITCWMMCSVSYHPRGTAWCTTFCNLWKKDILFCKTVFF